MFYGINWNIVGKKANKYSSFVDIWQILSSPITSSFDCIFSQKHLGWIFLFPLLTIPRVLSYPIVIWCNLIWFFIHKKLEGVMMVVKCKLHYNSKYIQFPTVLLCVLSNLILWWRFETPLQEISRISVIPHLVINRL